MPTTWVRSSRCSLGNCVELAALPDGTIAVRDSKHPNAEPLAFTQAEIAAFLAGVHHGDFDHLVTQPACQAVEQPLEEFVEWFRNDLVYKAPEVWPGHVSWFLNQLTARYGRRR